MTVLCDFLFLCGGEMTNKYILTYTTGDEYENSYHVEPIYFKGSESELIQAFHDIYKGILLRDRFISSLSKLDIISSYHRNAFSHNGEFKIGSRCLDIYDFLENGVLYPPTIRTLDKWFNEEGHE